METLKFEDFTKEQRHIMAEFVYSYENDILIKSDATNLLNVMLEKQMIDKEDFETFESRVQKNHSSILEDIIEILFTTVEENDGKRIMNEYKQLNE